MTTSLLLSALLALPASPPPQSGNGWEIHPVDPGTIEGGETPGGSIPNLGTPIGSISTTPIDPRQPRPVRPGSDPVSPQPSTPTTTPTPTPTGAPPPRPVTPLGGAPRPSTPYGPLVASVPATPRVPVIEDLDSWEVWWRLNRESYLSLERGPRGPLTGDAVAIEAAADPREGRAISQNQLRNHVVPALIAVLESDPDGPLASAALLGLARLGDVPGAEIPRHLRAYLRHSNLRVVETACIALGLQGDPRSLPDLAALLDDSSAGRELVDRARVTPRLQAFAAYGLGLAASRSTILDARRFAAQRLEAALAGERAAQPDVRVAAMIALGQVAQAEDASVSQGTLALRLLAILRDGREEDAVRAHAPGTLALLVHGLPEEMRAVVIETLLETAYKRSSASLDIRQGCVLALGALGDDDDDPLDVRVRHTLHQIAVNGKSIERGLATLALAQVGGRRGQTDSPRSEGAREVHAYLVERLRQAKSQERPWVALAFGILGHAWAQDGRPLLPEERSALEKPLAKGRSGEQAAALHLGAGLLGSTDLAATLAEMSGLNEDGHRVHGAWSIGLADARAGLETLRALLPDSEHRPDLLEAASLGLAQLDDPELVPALLELLEGCDCLLTHASVARALGRVGDDRAVAPLLALVSDTKNPSLERAYAALALGALGDRDPREWTWRLSTGLNYHANPATLFGQGEGILDLPQ